MSRLPFDPAKTAAAANTAEAAKPTDAPLRVGQLAGLIDSALREKLSKNLRVVGEIGNFTDRTHWYFTLKDADAVVSCVMFQFVARRVGFTPSVGQEVVATGSVEFYKPQGKVTFRVERLEPVGAGALELAYRKLVEELRGLGWFDVARKRRLPAFPRKIAVVTSRTGAAFQDVLDTLKRRCPGIEVGLIDTLVQGAAAAPAIAQAIRWVSANAQRLAIDTLIVTRGGGSMEDLWAFNDKQVAEAIVACSIPVAAAIGHETDTTIAELVADERCATPTQAAMRCSPDRAALDEQIASATGRLAQAVSVELRAGRDRLRGSARDAAAAARARVGAAARAIETLSARLESHKPAAVYERRRARVEHAAERLALAIRRRVEGVDLERAAGDLRLVMAEAARATAERLAAAQRQLELVGPRAVMERGYSVTLRADGQAVRRPADVRPGEPLVTRLADGSINSTVTGDGAAAVPAPTPMPPAPVTPRRRVRREESGPGLFG